MLSAQAMPPEEWQAWRNGVDALPDVQPIDRGEWLRAIEEDLFVAAVADDWWRLINHFRKTRRVGIAKAAEATYQQIINGHRLSGGIADMRYQRAVGLIEKHMRGGGELRKWHARKVGV